MIYLILPQNGGVPNLLDLMTRDYYGFHFHVGELQPTIQTWVGFKRLASPFGVASHCTYQCMPRVAQKIRGIRTYSRPLLPPH